MMLRIYYLIFVTTLVAGTPLSVVPYDNVQLTFNSTPRANLQDYILPNTLYPLEYNVRIIPYLEVPAEKAFTFDGAVEILFRTETATNTIKMHAYDIVILGSSIQVKQDNPPNPEPIFQVTGFQQTPNTDDRHFVTITLDKNLLADEMYKVSMQYTGILNDQLDGFYRSSFTDSTGSKKWLAVTQFAPVGARRAFPCFDEPALKAVFSIHIGHQPDYVVQSNMPSRGPETPVIEVPGLTGWYWTHFENSLLMSTYLIAFSVNPYESITNPIDDRFKVWAQPEKKSQGMVANSLAPKILSLMEFYTDIKYSSFMKVDQIAIPDFKFGAMENWGLIVYRENALLFEKGVSNTFQRQFTERIVTHELIHQWFGNLVTPKWWDHIWLNEGFANYYEYHTLAEVEPSWRMEELFIKDITQFAMIVDSLEPTHPIVIPNVVTPAEVNAIFDTITYNKGAAMVRMLVQLLGQENFRNGISQHLKLRAFNSVVTDNLWSRLSAFVPNGLLPPGVTLKGMMDTWTLQSGYPVLYVTRDYTTNTIKTSQRRFLTHPTPGNTYNEKYMIPVTFASPKNPNFDDVTVNVWQQGGDSVISGALVPTKSQWLIANKKQIGFYRVNYDTTNWKFLAAALVTNKDDIHVINRAQLLDDSFSLALANQLSYERGLEIADYLVNETEYLPWATAVNAFAILEFRMNFEKDARELYEWYVLSLIKNAYNLVNGITETNDDSNILRMKRSYITNWACHVNHEKCNNEASASFQQWKLHASHGMTISPDLKKVVYCSGMRKGDRSDYDFLFDRYNQSERIYGERAIIVEALGCASSTDLLQRYLDASIDSKSIIQGIDVFAAVCSHYNGINLSLDFIIKNWKKALNFYGGNKGVGRAFEGIAYKLNTQTHLDKLKSFLKTNEAELGETKVSVEKAITTVENIIKWHNKNRNTIISYLNYKRDINSASLSVLSPSIMIVSIVISNIFKCFN